jgi:flagellar basal body-associated protein FliL
MNKSTKIIIIITISYLLLISGLVIYMLTKNNLKMKKTTSQNTTIYNSIMKLNYV